MTTCVGERVQEIVRHLFGPGINSTSRPVELLHIIMYEPAEIFWPVFSQVWNSCDDTWQLKGDVLRLMRSQTARLYIEPKRWPVRVYRGCSRARVRGLSWTTSRTIAERFARGHRGIPVPDPVIAEATVGRPAVFVAIEDRNEAELIIDPSYLRRLVVTNPSQRPMKS